MLSAHNMSVRKVRVMRWEQLGRIELGILQGQAHCSLPALTLRRHVGDVIGVSREPQTSKLGVDLRAASARVFILFQNQARAPCSEHGCRT